MNTSFKDFFKEYRWLIIIITGLPLLLTACYLIIFYDNVIGKDIWAEIITSIISYAGTIGWGIFIFHNSWLKSKASSDKHKLSL